MACLSGNTHVERFSFFLDNKAGFTPQRLIHTSFPQEFDVSGGSDTSQELRHLWLKKRVEENRHGPEGFRHLEHNFRELRRILVHEFPRLGGVDVLVEDFGVLVDGDERGPEVVGSKRSRIAAEEHLAVLVEFQLVSLEFDGASVLECEDDAAVEKVSEGVREPVVKREYGFFFAEVAVLSDRESGEKVVDEEVS